MLTFYLKNNELLNLKITYSLLNDTNTTMDDLCHRFNIPYSSMHRNITTLSHLLTEIEPSSSIKKINQQYVLQTGTEQKSLDLCQKLYHYYLEHSLKFKFMQALICDDITQEFKLCDHLNISPNYLITLHKKTNESLAKYDILLTKKNRRFFLEGSYLKCIPYIYKFKYTYPSHKLLAEFEKNKNYYRYYSSHYKQNLNTWDLFKFFILKTYQQASLLKHVIPVFDEKEKNTIHSLVIPIESHQFNSNKDANNLLNILSFFTMTLESSFLNVDSYFNKISYSNDYYFILACDTLAVFRNYLQSKKIKSDYLVTHFKYETYLLSLNLSLSSLLTYDFNSLFNTYLAQRPLTGSTDYYEKLILEFMTLESFKTIFEKLVIKQSDYYDYLPIIQETCASLLRMSEQHTILICIYLPNKKEMERLIINQLTHFFKTDIITFTRDPHHADLVILNNYPQLDYAKHNILYLNDLDSEKIIQTVIHRVVSLHLNSHD